MFKILDIDDHVINFDVTNFIPNAKKIEESLDYKCNDLNTLSAYGCLLAIGGNVERSEIIFNQLYSEHGRMFLNILLERAKIYNQSDSQAAAEYCLDMAMLLDSTFVEAMCFRAAMHLSKKEYGHCATMTSIAKNINPQSLIVTKVHDIVQKKCANFMDSSPSIRNDVSVVANVTKKAYLNNMSCVLKLKEALKSKHTLIRQKKQELKMLEESCKVEEECLKIIDGSCIGMKINMLFDSNVKKTEFAIGDDSEMHDGLPDLNFFLTHDEIACARENVVFSFPELCDDVNEIQQPQSTQSLAAEIGIGEIQQPQSAQSLAAENGIGEIQQPQSAQSLAAEIGIGEIQQPQSLAAEIGIGEIQQPQSAQSLAAEIGIGEIQQLQSLAAESDDGDWSETEIARSDSKIVSNANDSRKMSKWKIPIDFSSDDEDNDDDEKIVAVDKMQQGSLRDLVTHYTSQGIEKNVAFNMAMTALKKKETKPKGASENEKIVTKRKRKQKEDVKRKREKKATKKEKKATKKEKQATKKERDGIIGSGNKCCPKCSEKISSRKMFHEKCGWSSCQ
jgi:hypothetical protein